MQRNDQDGINVACIQADFDRIAVLPEERWDTNSHYHAYLLRHLPPRCATALEVGCGTGRFARALAERAQHVLALDLSLAMIAAARAASSGQSNIEFQVADVRRWDWPADRFDCIVSIATLHHLPLEEMLSRMKHALAAGGTLVVLDLYRPDGLADLARAALALPLHIGLRLLHTRQLRISPAARAAWEAHARSDSYLTVRQVRRICAAVLPGARVRTHLFWRYSIVWRKESPARPFLA